MSMLLGINFEDHAFLSADTRATDLLTRRKKDNIQKIEFLPKYGLIVAAAGRARIASEILGAINSGLIETPVTVRSLHNNFDKILDKFLKKEMVKKNAPLNPLGPVAMIFHEYDRDKIYMGAIHIEFEIDTKIAYKIHEHDVKNGQYIIVGDIGKNAPIEIANLPDDSKNISIIMNLIILHTMIMP